ncbi:hypothetical protein TWF106_005533 [Orbilia oligospora]|uniref:MYND-type domain-containing protein n=1 Tax=Orbilia oligospora TaxID=2813651 RepID=A0A7C8UNQ4_ORBOL|nr:hypothetical protein TWF106_005533 [Orbilia oligospora]
MAQTATDTRVPSTVASSILEEYEPTREKTCAICGSQTVNTCSTCHGVAYCNAAHETQDRYYHRLICSAAVSIPPRPPGENLAAILVLPEHSKTPYYAWTPYKLNRHNLPVFEQSSWYGEGYKSKPMIITCHPITRQTLPHAIMIFEPINPPPGQQPLRTTLEKPQPHTNLCVHNLTNGVNSSAFKGTLLIVTLGRTQDRSKTWIMSFKPEDILILVEELKRPGNQIAPPVKSASIKAVACFPTFEPDLTFNGDNASDFKHADYVVFESLDIPVDHPIFTYRRKDPHIYTPPLGVSYRFPIRMFRFLNYHGLRGNKFVPTLFPTVDIIHSTTGTRPSAKQSKFIAAKLGAVLFARTDKKPLEVSHLREFSEFVGNVTKTWQAYDSFMTTQERALAKHTKNGKMEMRYVKISREQMDMVIEMDKTLEGKAFKEFWMEKNDGRLGPFEGVNMDLDEDEEDEEDESEDEGGPEEGPE